MNMRKKKYRNDKMMEMHKSQETMMIRKIMEEGNEAEKKQEKML